MTNPLADLSPAQRATARLLEHAILIALCNGVLAGLAFIDQYKTITFQALAICIVSQVVLALLSTGVKYYKASGDTPLSTLFDMVRQEVVSRTPAVQYSANEQAIQAVVSDVFSVDASDKGPVAPSISIPVVQAPPTVQPVQVPASEVTKLNTLPSMPAIQSQMARNTM